MVQLKSTWFWRLALPFITAWSLSNSALAFDSHEHMDMSNAALLISRHVVHESSMPPERKAAVDQAIAALLRQSLVKVDGRRIMAAHFGQITSCVDFFLTPEKMLALHWKKGRQQERPDSDLDGFPVQGLYPLDALESLCQRTGAGFLQASHSNHTHFQQDLLMALRVWHRLAISVANEEKNLFGGLFLSAIAGHYLQDFFAPGHLATPRDAMTDVPATAMHDLANTQGVYFQPKPPSQRLMTILKSIKNLSARSLQTCKLREGEDPLEAHCALQLAGFWDAPNTRVDIEPLLTGPPAPLLFLGDDRLMRQSQDQQRLLLLAVQVQSILDVVENRNSLNSFWFSLDSDGVPHAEVNFGQYQFSSSKTTSTARVETPVLRQQQPTSTYRAGTIGSIISLSDQRESQSSGAYSARSVYTLEWTTGGFIKDLSDISKNYLNRIEVRPSFGYAIYDQGRRTGHGPTARLALTVPETEISFGPYLRWFTHHDRDRTVRKLTGGIRLEGGFSSYLTFYVTSGIDYSTAVSGVLERGRMWGGGLRVSVPTSRIGLFN